MTSPTRRCHSLLFLAPMLAVGLTAPVAQAARRIDLHGLDPAPIARANAVIAKTGGDAVHARHEHALGLDADSRLVLIQRTTALGVRSNRYQQTFRGLPVFGEHVVVSEDTAGNLRDLFGRKVIGLANDIRPGRPTLGAREALAIGKSAGLGNRIGFMSTRDESAALGIHIDDAGHARKAYLVSFFADTARGGSPTRPSLLVDAETGRILLRRENLQTVEIGTGPGGNLKTGQYEYGVQYGKLDVSQYSNGYFCQMDNAKVKTTNNSNSTADTGAATFVCPRNTFKAINGAYAPLNDAHYFGGVVHDLYQSIIGRGPLASIIRLRVHYGTNWENASWDGVFATFGDGGPTYHPLTSLDVVSHELSHGFTAQTSSLAYSDQSGGINEAYSDMAGEAAKYYLRGSNDFKVGYDIRKDGGAMRYMYNPPLDGASIGHASAYTPGLDVHYSSGVYNKAFYLLATKPGWNTGKAFRVFLRANLAYWTPSTDFNQGVCGVLSAARDYAYSLADVMSAFNAVGTACPSGGGTGRDVIAIGKMGGSGKTEVHGLNGAGAYQSFSSHIATTLGQTGTDGAWAYAMGDYNKDGVQDLYVIKKQGGSGKTEVHVLNGANGFQNFLLQTATVLGATGTDGTWQFDLGDYNRDGTLDLYGIFRMGGSGKTEVHVMNGANNFQTFLEQHATVLGQTGSDGSWIFKVADFNNDGSPDVYGILRTAGSNSTEVHVMNGANGFQNFLLQTTTMLPKTGSDYSWSFGVGHNDGGTTPDLFAISKQGYAGSGMTEVFVLAGEQSYQKMTTANRTALGVTGSNQAWEFVIPR